MCLWGSYRTSVISTLPWASTIWNFPLQLRSPGFIVATSNPNLALQLDNFAKLLWTENYLCQCFLKIFEYLKSIFENQYWIFSSNVWFLTSTSPPSVTGEQQKVKSKLIWHFSFCTAAYNQGTPSLWQCNEDSNFFQTRNISSHMLPRIRTVLVKNNKNCHTIRAILSLFKGFMPAEQSWVVRAVV